MRKYLLSLLSILVLFPVYSQELELSSMEDLIRISSQQEMDESFGFGEPPPAFSLEKYCPIPIEQDGRSCVGLAIAYGAMSTTYNFVHDYSRTNYKFINVFDPYYIYASIKSAHPDCIGSDCDCGTRIWEGLDLLVNYGCKKMYVSPTLECSSTLTRSNLRSLVSKTMYYTIDDYYMLIDYKELANGEYDKEVHLDVMKWGITNGQPVIAAIVPKTSFTDGVTAVSGNYSPGSDEKDLGSHCVTIVGYDDNRNGGSFRIMNSYGSKWGDDGFFWMTYKDFEKYVQEAYIMGKEDWKTWSSPYAKEDYYKGVNADKEEYFEGTLNSEGFFHGKLCIVMTKIGAGFGSYNNGFKHGWWVILENSDARDKPFHGFLLFDNGKIIDSEAFGFSSETVMDVETVSKSYHLDKINITLNAEPGTADDFSEEAIKAFGEKGSK